MEATFGMRCPACSRTYPVREDESDGSVPCPHCGHEHARTPADVPVLCEAEGDCTEEAMGMCRRCRRQVCREHWCDGLCRDCRIDLGQAVFGYFAEEARGTVDADEMVLCGGCRQPFAALGGCRGCGKPMCSDCLEGGYCLTCRNQRAIRRSETQAKSGLLALAGGGVR